MAILMLEKISKQKYNQGYRHHFHLIKGSNGVIYTHTMDLLSTLWKGDPPLLNMDELGGHFAKWSQTPNGKEKTAWSHLFVKI